MLTSPMHAADALLPATSSLLTVQDSHGNMVSRGKLSVVRIDRHTGRLTRATIGSSALGNARVQPVPANIKKIVDQNAQAYGVDPLLVESVIQVESAYNTYAVSSKGAQGLMQLMPGTSRWLGVGNSFDPTQNIEAGVRYLKALQEQYKDDRLALAAYNAGPKAVSKYKQIPPYAETTNYVEKVGSQYRAAHAQAAARTNSSPETKAVAELSAQEYNEQSHSEQHPKLEQFIDDQGRLYLKTAAE